MSPGPAGVTMDDVTTATTQPLVRLRSGRFVAGVAGGVAAHLGVPVLWVRAAFVVLAGVGGAGVLAYGLLWIFVPAGDRRRRPARPAGRAPAGDRARGAGHRRRHRGQRGGRLVRRAGSSGRSAWPRSAPPSCGGRPTRPSAAVDRGRPHRAVRLVGAVAGDGGRGVRRGRDRRVPVRQPAARADPVRPARRGGHARRRRGDHGAVVAQAGARPRRGAPRAHRRGRARGDRRAPARLRAADARADPTPVRPAPRGAAAGPRAGARAAALALRARRVRQAGPWRAAGWPRRSRRPRPRSRTPTRSTCDPSSSATAPSTTTCAPSSSPPARPWSTRPSTPRWTRSACTSRPRRTPCTCSSATGASASTPTRCPTTGTASPTPCTPASPATAVTSGCAARPARAPRCTCACRVSTPQEASP